MCDDSKEGLKPAFRQLPAAAVVRERQHAGLNAEPSPAQGIMMEELERFDEMLSGAFRDRELKSGI
jgi:hypothetical protein